MLKARGKRERESSAAALPPVSAAEVVERHSFDLLNRYDPEVLAAVTELVKVGNTDEEIAEYFAGLTGREEWELEHVACAAAHVRRRLEIINEGGVH